VAGTATSNLFAGTNEGAVDKLHPGGSGKKVVHKAKPKPKFVSVQVMNGSVTKEEKFAISEAHQ
jgi:hypothetical protein